MNDIDWQPIATAPKDWRDILVCYQNCDSWFIHVAFWLEDEDEPENTGWWAYTLSEVSRTKLDGPWEPTHWAPSPGWPR